MPACVLIDVHTDYISSLNTKQGCLFFQFTQYAMKNLWIPQYAMTNLWMEVRIKSPSVQFVNVPEFNAYIFIFQMVSYLEDNGLKEEGVLRVPGSSTRVKVIIWKPSI